MKTHKVRHKNGDIISVNITRNSAIRLMCTECFGYEGSPRDCTSTLCPLFPYRGKTLKTCSEIKKEPEPKQVVKKKYVFRRTVK